MHLSEKAVEPPGQARPDLDIFLDYAARMGFTSAQTVAFGDGENDIELVEWADYGVAVENAHPRVKAVADWICPSAEDEGVAQVIEAYLDSRA